MRPPPPPRYARWDGFITLGATGVGVGLFFVAAGHPAWGAAFLLIGSGWLIVASGNSEVGPGYPRPQSPSEPHLSVDPIKKGFPMRRYLPAFISIICAIAANTILSMFIEVPYWARLLVGALVVLIVTVTVHSVSKRFDARHRSSAATPAPATNPTSASDA